ncbi:MAG TPA: serine/threonine-protein kinase [Pyrinomonadaceae bacterium]|nr:serine/threonine-protein kinase [Pyrinomonadaceae bacterium]
MTVSHEFGLDAESPLKPDTVLQNRYRIVRQLGRGGMGAVYEAADERLGIAVALKETLSSEASMRKQFEHEARLLASMQHPALPRVSDYFVEGNRAFLVMQFIGGVDLARIISQQPGPLPPEQVIAWADQLLDALIYLHSRDRQVIHRDIKPHNLKLTSTGKIALLDFGLARAQSAQATDVSVTASRAFFGYTRHYAPLEQIQDQRTDPRTDIYALGATLYHLLTGIKPPDAMVRATALINSDPDPLRPANKVHEAVGPEIAAILNKAMAQKPEHRYATANEFREAFRRMGRTKESESRTRDLAGTTEKVTGSTRKTAQPVEPTVLQMAMVESARRFGPGSMTVVLLIVLTLSAGVLYGSKHWWEATAAKLAPAASESRIGAKRPPAVPARAEAQQLAPDSLGVSVAKTRTTNTADTAERLSGKKPAAGEPATTAQAPRLGRTRGPLKGRNRIGAPSIRLPNPEFRNNTAEPSPESRFRTYSSSGSVQRLPAEPRSRRYRPSGPTPKFFRAPDGSQIVKFSDGLTRIVRPGERTARAGASYR